MIEAFHRSALFRAIVVLAKVALSFSSGVALLPFFLLPAIEDAIRPEFPGRPIHSLIRMPLVVIIYMIVGIAWLINFETWTKSSKPQYSYLLNLILLSFALSFETTDVAPFFWILAAIYAGIHLAFSSKTRLSLYSAFSSRSIPGPMETRYAIMTTGLATGIISSILVFLKFRDIFTICLALVSWLAVAHAAKGILRVEGKESTLKYHFAESVTEFLAVCASAVAACCITSIIITHFLPGWLTVRNFITAKEWIAATRDVTHNLKLTSTEGIGSLLCLWLLRFLMLRARKQSAQSLLDKTSSAIKRVNKLVRYVYLACVAATSFALANSRPGAALEALNTRIETILSIQASAQSHMFWYLQAEYKRKLFDEAWRLLPPGKQSAVISSERRLSDDWDVFKHYEGNRIAYGLDYKDLPAEFQTFPQELRFRSAASFNLSIAPTLPTTLTLGQLRASDQDSEGLERQGEEAEMPAYLQGVGKELAHKIFDATLPLEDLGGIGSGNSTPNGFLEHIGDQYPVIQEMVSSVVGAAQDYTFDKVWALAGKVISRKAKEPTLTLDACAKQSVEELVGNTIHQSPQKQAGVGVTVSAAKDKSTRIKEIDELSKKALLERIDAKRLALRESDPIGDALYRVQHPDSSMQYRSTQASKDALGALLKIDQSETVRMRQMLPHTSGVQRQRMLDLMGVPADQKVHIFDGLSPVQGDLPDGKDHPSEIFDPVGK
jgi:hypothetical protein